MPLTITQRVEDEIGVLELSGPMTLGPGLVEVRNKARQLLDTQNVKGLIVDVGAVTQTDSSGLGEFTVIYSLVTKKGYPLRLVRVKPELRKILELTRLDGLLPTTADVSSAKAEMRKGGAAKSACSRG
jgi:anti-anti-sigma factor